MSGVDVTRNKGYNREARRIINEPEVQKYLTQIAERVKNNAGPGHAVKADRSGDRVRVQVFTASDTAKVNEARDKSLSKAFAAERKQPRRYL
jgi:hypothetical protein